MYEVCQQSFRRFVGLSAFFSHLPCHEGGDGREDVLPSYISIFVEEIEGDEKTDDEFKK